MTTVRLPQNIELRLSELSRLTHRSKSFYIKEALNKYLEDIEDTYIALERVSSPKRKLLTTEEILKELNK